MRRLLLVGALLVAAGCVTAPEAPPPTPAATAAVARLPEPQQITLSNGLLILLVPDPSVPLVGFEARIAGGHLTPFRRAAGLAPPGGVAALLAELLRRGAGDRDAQTFREDVERRGGRVWSSASARSIVVGGEFLAEDADWMLGVLADVLLRPRLEAAEFEKARQLAVDGVRADKDEPQEVIARYWQQWALGRDDAYAAPVGGDEAALLAVQYDQVTSVWRQIAQPQNVVVAVTGDFAPDAVRSRLADLLGAGDHAPPTTSGIPVRPPAPGGRVLLVDKPDAVQTHFRFGGAGIPWDDADHAARELANTVLGGRFTSRLNTALRIEAGLTYGAASDFDDERGGLFAVRTYTAVDTSREAIELALATYRHFRADGLTQAELDSARTYIKGQYAPDHLETAPQAASLLLDLRELAVPRAAVDDLFARLGAVTLADVNRSIRERFPAEPLTWVVIGPADRLRDVVAPLGEVTEIAISAPGFGPR